jgi:rhodanese-related sulfurtransferase
MHPALRSLPVAAIVLLAAPAPADAAAEAFGRLTIEDVAKKLDDKTFFVFDVNSKDTYKRSHVPHARWLQYDKVSAADLPADKDATLVFYCANPH